MGKLSSQGKVQPSSLQFPKLNYAEWHLTDKCNLNCYFCNQACFRKYRISVLPGKLIFKTLSRMMKIGLSEIRLSGGGEPSIHPAFSDIIGFLHDNKIKLSNITTNGLALNDKLLDQMCSIKWDSVLVSLSTCDECDWIRVIGGGKKGFERVLKNIRYLVEKRKSLNLRAPQIMITFGIDSTTYKKIIKAYEFMCELGVDGIAYISYNNIKYPRKMYNERDTILNQLRIVDTANKINKKIIVYHMPDLKLNAAIFNEVLLSKSRKGGRSHRSYSLQLASNPLEPCFMPWHGTTILANGNVVLCCAAGSSFPILGNIHKEPFELIWHGKYYTEIRKRFEKIMMQRSSGNIIAGAADFPPICMPSDDADICCPIKIAWQKFKRYYPVGHAVNDINNLKPA